MLMNVEQSRSMSLLATMSAESDNRSERRFDFRRQGAYRQVAQLVGEQAIQLHGGIAMTMEYKAGHYFKRLTMIENTLWRHRLPSAPGHRMRAG